MVTKKTAAREIVSIKSIQKRNGLVTSFDLSKIKAAIYKAMIQTGEGSEKEAELVANKVYAELIRITKKHKNFVPTVE
ncbi:MAG: Ribonucleoside-diphosphate reductase, beta subunit, partial [Candidatus Yanofskybacteria bacterium GW2011_GWC2_41_9]